MKILRVRAGHLANFSGGAGYMPFIAIFAIPFTLLYDILAKVTISIMAKPRKKADENIDFVGLIKALKKHMLWSFIIALCLSVVFLIWGLNHVYDKSLHYILFTIIGCAAPFIVSFLTTAFLTFLFIKTGYSKLKIFACYVLFFILEISLFSFFWIGAK